MTRIQRFLIVYSALLTLIFVLTTAAAIVKSAAPTNFDEITVKKINVIEQDGTLRAVLSSSSGFNYGQRAEMGPVKIAGLMFYNEEGQETGGLVFRGRAIPGGQDAAVAMTFDQFRQDQNVYLHHEEHRDPNGLQIDDGLTVNARPDFANVQEEFQTYDSINKMPPDKQDAARLQAVQAGKIFARRLFFGVRRGVQDGRPYDDGGLFIKNKWGRDAIKIYVDEDNKPHLEFYDELGKSIVYDLKVTQPKKNSH